MSSIRPYLHLDGTTKQAMQFYKEVLGGDLEIMTVGETEWAKDMPLPNGQKADPNKVMHAALSTKDWVLMAADMMDPSSFTKGDNVSLTFVCDTKDEIERIYKQLSAGGDVFQELGHAPFGWYAQFTDKFGIDWMLQSNAQ